MKIPEQLLIGFNSQILGSADFKTMFNHLPIGVLAADAEGYITYYNPYLAKVDSLEEDYAIGRHVLKVYGPDPGPSLVMICLESGKPVIDYFCVYRTAPGKLVNASHFVFPFFDRGKVAGCLCFLQHFSTLEPAAPQASSVADLAEFKRPPVNFDKIVGRNLELQKAIATASLAAQTPSSVMIYGETGTGKEMFAVSIHRASPRRSQPFVALNCAAIPEQLLEGLLFGTTRGAFTGAVEKKGLLEEASGGSIFLDEVDSMPLALQPKLLRALQEKKIRRVGSSRETAVDIKIISATSVSPLLAVEHGKLRSDLFYRLGVVLVNLPPLRRRIDDLEDLVAFFILKYNGLLGKKVIRFSREVIKLFRAYNWPGNIRELEHLVEGALNLAGNHSELGLDFLPEYFQEKSRALLQQVREDSPLPSRPEAQTPPTGENEEAAAIINAMRAAFGNTTLAAKILGLSRQLLTYRLKKYHIDKRDFKI